MPYPFDTDGLSEPLRQRPARRYIEWLEAIPRSDQFTSAVTMGELYNGAFRVPDAVRRLRNIETRVWPAVTVVPCDAAVARVYAAIEAALSRSGRRFVDADLQIAATAIYHGLDLVTGHLRHFSRVPHPRLHTALADAR